MRLPDGLTQPKIEAKPALPEIDTKKVLRKLTEYVMQRESAADSKQLMDPSIGSDANLSLLKNAELGRLNEALQTYKMMNALQVPVEPTTLVPLIKAATKKGDFEMADQLFDEVLHDDNREVSMDLWAAKVNNLARKRDGPAAEKILNDLVKRQLKPLASMYTSVFSAYLTKKTLKKAWNIWMQMHEQGVLIELEAFHLAFDYCKLNNNAEKSFHFWEEMRVYGHEPTVQTCARFLRSVSVAPHFMPGFEDMVFDAMALVEGKELVPDAQVYDAIITCFALARDPVAAEYYFWEMKRKGIQPKASTYNILLESYYQAQTVGAQRYGHLGRYAKPDAEPLSPDQQDVTDLGPLRVAAISKFPNIPTILRLAVFLIVMLPSRFCAVNQGAYTDFEPEKHGKRVKQPKIIDPMVDGDEEGELAHEDFMDQVRQEAAELRAERARTSKKKEVKPQYLDDMDLEEVAQGDPAMVQFLEMVRDDEDGMYNDITIDGLRFNPDRHKNKNSLEAGTAATQPSLEDLSKKQQERLALKKIYDVSATSFTDPFTHMDELRGVLQEESPEAREARLEREEAQQRLNSVALLDNAGVAPSPKRLASSLASAQNKPELHAYLERFDRQAAKKTAVTEDDIERGFDLVYFGRAPDADYSMNIGERRLRNIHRAELAFKDMIEHGFAPSPRALLMLMGVHCETPCNHAGADGVLARYAQYNIMPEPHTFRLLVKMHIRNKDMDSAMEVFEGMKEKGVVPDEETYGLLINSYVGKGQVVDALKVLEDAAARKVEVPEKHLRALRGRCENLGVKHPDIPPNPLQWVRDVKKTRMNQRHASQRVIQEVRSLTFE
jgi:pentatricopeptide repeat protein